MKSFVAVLLALVVITVFVVVAALYVGGGRSKEQMAFDESQVIDRIKPLGEVYRPGAEPPAEATAAAPAASGPKSGADVVAAACAACHTTGALNAPKIGDNAAWNARAGKGVDTLVANAINGIGQMPAKGGNAALSDAEVRSAVVEILAQSGIGGSAKADTAAPAPAARAQQAAPAAAAAASSASGSANLSQGKTTYGRACAACHGTGVAGAPKLGDKGAWSARIAQGPATLLEHAIKGFQGQTGFMPPKGGHPYLSDEQIADSVAYMVSESQ